MWLLPTLPSSFKPTYRLCLATLVALTFPLCSLSQEPTKPQLHGLWGAETRFGTPVQGTLTLDARTQPWQALIASYRVEVNVEKDQVSFELPANMGSFRGHRNPTRNTIEGHWIQPGGLILDPEYATPIELRSITKSIWQGEVLPLEQRLSVYLQIVSGPEGLTATVTNPEGNFFRRRVYRVTQKDSTVSLEANGKTMQGTYDSQADVLTIPLATWLPSFRLTRRSKENAPGFYPRTPSTNKEWHYQPPLPLEDGWRTSTLQAESLDQKAVTQLVEKILTRTPGDTSLDIQSLLIARHGHLVLEEYFDGFSVDRVHDMRSAGKTFAPVLVGVAKEHGANLTPRTLLYPLFSQYSSFANPDPRKQQIRLQDVMIMTAGNACDDNDDNSPGNEDRMQDSTHRDWYKYTLDLPMLNQPGNHDAIYCSGDLNLVGGAVAAAAHTWLPDLFQSRIARPLQFGRYYLNLMPDHQAYMGGGIYLRPRDQLKLGQLYLNGGIWNGRRIVSSQWVNDSVSVHSRFADDRSLGQKHEYGYGWHIHALSSRGHTYKVFAAEGNGGQFVIVIPSLDMVVGITGGAYGEFAQWYPWELDLIPKLLLPAVK